MYGTRGRVGVIEISSSTALSAELPSALPIDVLGVVARLRLPRQEVSIAALDEMLSGTALELAAAQLGDAGVDVISFGCTSGSFLRGAAWDARLAERIEDASGVRATTTTSAVVAALRSLNATRIGLATPYPDEINDAEVAFLTEAGFDVVAVDGLSLATDPAIGALTPNDVRQLAQRVAATPSDVIFLSCTNMPTLPLLADISSAVQRPVVSSNSATIWDACRHLGVVAADVPHPAAWSGRLAGRGDTIVSEPQGTGR